MAGIKPGIRHEKTGQSFLRAFWKESGEDRQSCALMSKIIGAHHQGKAGSGNYSASSAWQPICVSLEKKLRQSFFWRSDISSACCPKGKAGINRAREEFESDEGKAVLRELGIEGEWEGIGHCIVGYTDGAEPEAKPRKDDRTVWVA